MTIYGIDDENDTMPRPAAETSDLSGTEDGVRNGGDVSDCSAVPEGHGDGDASDPAQPSDERSHAEPPEGRDGLGNRHSGRTGLHDSDRHARHRQDGPEHLRLKREGRGGRGMGQAGRYESSSERRERERKERERNIVGSELYGRDTGLRHGVTTSR